MRCRRPRIGPVGHCLAALVALLVGALGGWFLARSFDDKPTNVVAGHVALTDRQREMIRVEEAYVKAWQANDVDAVLALYTPNGTLNLVPGSGDYRVDDGTLAAYVRSGDWSGLHASTRR